jgi:hypothetical protein
LAGLERILGAEHHRDAEAAEAVVGDQANGEASSREQALG